MIFGNRFRRYKMGLVNKLKVRIGEACYLLDLKVKFCGRLRRGKMEL